MVIFALAIPFEAAGANQVSLKSKDRLRTYIGVFQPILTVPARTKDYGVHIVPNIFSKVMFHIQILNLRF
jgi:hypothetical protein